MQNNHLVRNEAAIGHDHAPAHNPVLEMCRDLPECRLAAGATLLEEGQSAGVLYFLISGEVEVLKQGIQIDCVSEPGSVFGEISLLLNLPHTATVKALMDSRFHRAQNPSEFSRTHPELYAHISTLLAHRLHSLTDHLVETRLQLKFGAEHAVSHRITEALQRCFITPAS
jgi:CRP-like cAMP-binding protein